MSNMATKSFNVMKNCLNDHWKRKHLMDPYMVMYLPH